MADAAVAFVAEVEEEFLPPSGGLLCDAGYRSRRFESGGLGFRVLKRFVREAQDVQNKRGNLLVRESLPFQLGIGEPGMPSSIVLYR